MYALNCLCGYMFVCFVIITSIIIIIIIGL